MTTQTQEPQEKGELKEARLLDVKAKKIEKKADPPKASLISTSGLVQNEINTGRLVAL